MGKELCSGLGGALVEGPLRDRNVERSVPELRLACALSWEFAVVRCFHTRTYFLSTSRDALIMSQLYEIP